MQGDSRGPSGVYWYSRDVDQFLPRSRLEELARESGMMRPRRKVDPMAITGNSHPRTRARLVNRCAVRSRGPAGDEPCARVSPMDCR